MGNQSKSGLNTTPPRYLGTVNFCATEYNTKGIAACMVPGFVTGARGGDWPPRRSFSSPLKTGGLPSSRLSLRLPDRLRRRCRRRRDHRVRDHGACRLGLGLLLLHFLQPLRQLLHPGRQLSDLLLIRHLSGSNKSSVSSRQAAALLTLPSIGKVCCLSPRGRRLCRMTIHN